jgi:hypothetical protein
MALDTIPKQEGGKLKAVASGTLPSGQPVIVNADGTVSVITGTSASQSVGTETKFQNNNITYLASGFDSNSNKVVLAYGNGNNSYYGTAVVGAVSGSSISFGTPVVYESVFAPHNSVSFDSANNKVIISYQGSSSYGTSVVGTVSGTSISFGSPVVFNSTTTGEIGSSFDPDEGRVVLAYQDGNSGPGKAIVGTVSGTSISFGSEVQFDSNDTYSHSLTYDTTNNKMVLSYQDNGNTYGTSVVGTVSGTSISFGSATVFSASATYKVASCFDASQSKVVIFYRDGGDSNKGKAIVGSVSGTGISFGSAVVFASGGINNYLGASFDANANKATVVYADSGNSNHGTLISGEVSGTSITFGSETVFHSNTTTYMSSVYDSSANKVAISYIHDVSPNQYGASLVLQNAYVDTNLTSENYIGISTGGAVADGGNANVGIIGSVSDEQSGLTSGQSYYVQTDGTVGTTPADPSVLAGTAISATKMLVKT